MSGIGVITNPRSRQNRRNPRLARQLGYILGEKGSVHQPPDLDALQATVAYFREREIDILCVNGGDGTLHTAITAMVKAYAGAPLPKVALLRGGTMNTIAHGLGIRGTAAQILDYVVTRYHADAPMPTTRRWLMDVDGEQYGFLFGNGLIAQFLEVYYEGSDPTPTKAAWMLVRAILSAVVNGKLIQRLMLPWEGTIEVDGRTPWQTTKWTTVAAGTVDDIGLGFRPFYLSLTHPGKLHIVGMTGPATSIVKELPRIYRAVPTQTDDMTHDVGREVVLRSERPIVYMVDGDFHRGGQTLTLRIGPHVDLILPEL